MIEPNYTVFGHHLVVRKRATRSTFRVEDDSYPYFKKVSQANGWRFFRIDTVNQMGFPDMLMAKGQETWYVEAKRLKKKSLVSIEDDLEWQFGQLSFLMKALKSGMNYMLAVVKGSDVYYLKGDHNVKEYLDYPDFT